MDKKITITLALAVLMVAALLAPAVMADNVGYSATVVSSQSTSVGVGAGGVAFGDMLVTAEKTLTNSLNLTNTGGWPATVTAGFTTKNSTGTYGLNSTTGDVALPGNKFELGKAGNLKPLNIVITTVSLETANNIAAGAVNVSYNAMLTVPAGQALAIYSGTVELLFANV